jgi:two-component sensor histidine kinase
VRELTHRIGNEYASVIGLVSMATGRSRSAEVKQELSYVLNALHGYARVHSALAIPSHQDDISVVHYLRELCDAIGESRLKRRGIELLLVDTELEMNADKCWRLGLIIWELIANAERYAFGDQGGLIQIRITQSGPFVACRVTDDGSASVEFQPGEGLKLVEALANSLRGKVNQRFGPNGSETVIVFPQAH